MLGNDLSLSQPSPIPLFSREIATACGVFLEVPCVAVLFEENERLTMPPGQSCPSVSTAPALNLFLFQGCEDSRPLTSNFGLGRMGLQMSLHLGFCDLSLS